MIYLGSHVSFKSPDYYIGAIQEAHSYGANACMIYTGGPSNTKRQDLSKLKINEAKVYMDSIGFDISRVIVHAPYIINLANTVKPDVADFGTEFLLKEMKRVEALGANTLVLHPGSHMKAGIDMGLKSIVSKLNEVFEKDDTHVAIALETMAGKGSECGSKFEELAYIKEHVKSNSRIKVCMDTCHIWDAGYDLSDFDSVLEEFDHILGISNLACMHINDSKNILSSHKDRHANIGRGEIGFEILYNIVHHPKLDDITKILETPYIDGKPPYKKEILALKS